MARGGARPNSGPKPDSVRLKNREIAKAAIESGKQTPLEVMLEAMEYAMSQVRKTENALEKKIFYEAAHAHAKDAAPYIHAKLATMEIKNPDGETFKTTSSLADEDRAIIQRYLIQKGANK